MNPESQMSPISLSVFFPCYNEELNIERLTLEALEVLGPLVKEYEILIVDDGSRDKTGFIAQSLSEQHEKVRVVNHRQNRGYGAALISGFRASSYEWVFYTDGDGQFYIEEIERLLRETKDYDVIVGYRVKRKDSCHRILLAKVWNGLVRFLLELKIRDVNCAFKLVKKETIDEMTLHSTGAVISAELLVKAKLMGYRIKQTGVSHKARLFGTQTGGNPRVALRALQELLRLHKCLRSHKPRLVSCQ
jgi:glycosyltransferase involved in cell wall biosynthesis